MLKINSIPSNWGYGLTQFSKSKSMPDFSAIGNDYGLLILAKTGRLWQFTDRKAMPSRWRMEFIDSNGNLIWIKS